MATPTDPVDAALVLRRDRIRLHAIWLLVIASVVAWRDGTFYAGGIDPTVVAKAVLSVIALGLAWHGFAQAPRRWPIGARSFWIVCAYAVVSGLGGWAVGSLTASAVLSVRVVLVAVIVVLVLMTHPLSEVIRALFVMMGAVGLLAAVTGAGSFNRPDRLLTGIPPLSLNQVALLIAAPLLGLLWRILQGRGRPYDPYLVIALAGLSWLTGSRSGLLGLVVAAIVMILQSRRMSSATFVGLVALGAGAVYVALSTNLVTHFITRGDTKTLNNLNSRTIAWSAAFNMHTGFWQHWFGGGYAMKTIEVTGTFWSTQVIDSSWVVAYVQAGVLGMALLALWASTSIVSAFRCPSPWRMLLTGTMAYCLVRSVLESGLLDSQALFVMFFTVAVASEQATRQGREVPPVDRTDAVGLAPVIPLHARR